MSQSRKMSMVESMANVAIGYGIAILAQLVIFPVFGIHIPLGSNLLIGLFFTGVSFVRSYLLRRFFNSRERRKRKLREVYAAWLKKPDL